MRNSLLSQVSSQWPRKTKESYRFRSSFIYSGKWQGRVELDLLDYPGERMADADIARFESFASWSDHVLETLGVNASLPKDFIHSSLDAEIDLLVKNMELKLDVTRLTDCYLSEINSVSDSGQWLVSYKKLLTIFFVRYSQFITPSSFALDCQTLKSFSADDLTDKGKGRVCGLPGREFAPLPEYLRDKNKDLLDLWEKNYQAYRSEIVKKLFDYFNECDQLILMVDIPFTLSGGVQRYNSLIWLLESWTHALKPYKWYNPFTHLKKIAIVGTKKDLTVHDDEDNMKSLLNEIKKIIDNKFVSITCETFCVSAWISTEEIVGQRKLKGRLIKRNKGLATEIDENGLDIWNVPTPIPWEWPDDWTHGTYIYPLSQPHPLKNSSKPPKQSGMQDLFRFMVD
jgi:predicted YcjX-like family ATPase